jgi:hypothetical protein
MGLVMIIIWLVALAVTLAPGIGLAGVICGISKRNALFWVCLLVTLVTSVALQYVLALQPYVERGTYGIELMTVPIFTWYLAVPAVLAAILWFVLKARQRPVLAGAAAGLLLSIPVVVALALPVTFWAPDRFHLKFVP